LSNNILSIYFERDDKTVNLSRQLKQILSFSTNLILDRIKLEA